MVAHVCIAHYHPFVFPDLLQPTGVDPTHEQWKELSEIMKEKKHFPFFDMVRPHRTRLVITVATCV